MTLDAAARTHAGRVRTQNEDAFVCKAEAGLFAVVDGMGGQEAGEVAAAIAAEVIGAVPADVGLAGETVLARALKESRQRVLAEARAHPEWEGMGAVVTAVRVDDDGRNVCIAHVGDTRAYLVSGAGVRQITTDHLGPPPEPGRKRPVARDLGRVEMPEPWVETSRVRVNAGDVLILCSDGLHDLLHGEELATELGRLRRENKDADAIATRLVAMALGRGAPDNVTVVAVRVGSYTRGAPRRAWGLILGLILALVVGLASLTWLLMPQARQHVAELPDKLLPGDRVSFWPEAPVTITAGTTTRIDGASALIYGARLRGVDWTAVVQRGVLTMDAVDLTLEGPLVIDLRQNGSLVIANSTLRVATLEIRGDTSSRLDPHNLHIYTDNPILLPPGMKLDPAHVDVRPSEDTTP